MNCSHQLLKNNLNNFLGSFLKKKTHAKTLKSKIDLIQTLKQVQYKDINLILLDFNNPNTLEDECDKVLHIVKRSKVDENVLVMYVLDITVTRSNTYLNIFDSTGKLKLSVSAGNILDTSSGKRKIVRLSLLNAMFRIISQQKYLIGKPIALHLKNKIFIPSKFIKGLRKKRLLKSITFFHKVPFNGCRKKKVRSV